MAAPSLHAAQTTCVRGHDLTDPANVYRPPGHPNWRQCRTCRQMWKLEERFGRPDLDNFDGPTIWPSWDE